MDAITTFIHEFGWQTLGWVGLGFVVFLILTDKLQSPSRSADLRADNKAKQETIENLLSINETLTRQVDLLGGEFGKTATHALTEISKLALPHSETPEVRP